MQVKYLVFVLVAVLIPSGIWPLDDKVVQKCEALSGITTDEVTKEKCSQKCEMDGENAAFFDFVCDTGDVAESDTGKSFGGYKATYELIQGILKNIS